MPALKVLERTRSQHFVASPRKTPYKRSVRHPSKRRRVGSNTLQAQSILSSSSSDLDENAEESPSSSSSQAGPSRTREVLSSETGQQTVNRVRATTRRERAQALGVAENRLLDVFGSESTEESSPKKRKRGHREQSPPRSETSSSWVEMDEDEEEEEPDFIAESDQHLLQDAPAHTLHRLRKAELVRLWKVAGMWTEDEGDDIAQSSMEDDDDGGLTKTELVDGLIAARRRTLERRVSIQASPLASPHRRSTLDSSFELKKLRSASSSLPISASSSSSGSREDGPTSRPPDTDATPRANPRTRSKLRRTESNLVRSVHKRPNGGLNARAKGRGKENLFRSRSKSLGGEREDRRARFGDETKSPGKGSTNRQTRRASTQSSAYTTTDTSPPDNPPPTRQTPRRRKSAAARNLSTTRSLGKSGSSSSRVDFDAPADAEVIDLTDSDGEDEQPDPTPLVQRLRSRTRSSIIREPSSELEADGEEESEIDALSEASPRPTRQSRSQTKSDVMDDESMEQPARRSSRSLPARGAKQKAIEALKGGESEEEGMELDDQVLADEEAMVEEMDEDEAPSSGRMTRSQARAQAEEEHEEVDEESSEDEDADTSRERMTPSLTPLSPEANGHANHDDVEVDDRGIERQTRSGKTFGTWQNRRSRLRQEAMDDPDMEVDEDTDEDEDDDLFEPDVDLDGATHASLIRLLREELVQLCEARGIEVGGTKPQLAQALLDWRDEQNIDDRSTTSSQATARPKSSKASKSAKVIHAIGSNVHVSGKTTPVLLRDHIHATDPATPPHSDDSKRNGEAELNLDLSELGLEDSIIKPSQLQKLEKIGSGGFKDVYVGKLRGRKVAVSEFREHLSEMDIRELKLLAEFSHPNIVRFRGICIPEDNSQVPCMLVSELCENGDLFDYIRNVPCPPLKRVLQLMLDIARGLEYLHTRKPAIIHRDCKSSNILINRAGQAKVGDFGLARVKHSTRSMIRSLVGTVNWQAPELWHPQPRYDYKVDVFSAAVVYWEMLSGWIGEKKYPWEGHNEHYIYDIVGQKHKRPSVAGLRKHWGAEPVNLMERMWHQDAGERPTMTDVVVDLEVLISECR